MAGSLENLVTRVPDILVLKHYKREKNLLDLLRVHWESYWECTEYPGALHEVFKPALSLRVQTTVWYRGGHSGY